MPFIFDTYWWSRFDFYICVGQNAAYFDTSFDDLILILYLYFRDYCPIHIWEPIVRFCLTFSCLYFCILYIPLKLIFHFRLQFEYRIADGQWAWPTDCSVQRRLWGERCRSSGRYPHTCNHRSKLTQRHASPTVCLVSCFYTISHTYLVGLYLVVYRYLLLGAYYLSFPAFNRVHIVLRGRA